MHPCLDVDEVLRLLARELVASGANATAVSLARCRKSFEDPVLDALWRAQERLLPLLKSFPGDVWKVEAGRFVSPPTVLILSPSNCFTEEVFQEAPDERGMESFPKIRSGNTDTQSRRLRGPSNSGRSVGVATLHRQRMFASETVSVCVQECHRGFHSVYTPLSLPENHKYQHHIRPRLSRGDARVDNRQVSNAVSPHKVPRSQGPTEKSDHY